MSAAHDEPALPGGALPGAPLLGRRRFLRGALVAGLALGGGALGVATTGYDLPPGLAERLATLSRREAAVLLAVAERILAGLPEGVAPEAVARADAWLSRRERWVRREVRAALTLVEQGPPLVLRRLARFTRLAPAEQDEYLAALAASGPSLRRSLYLGLKGLVLLGAYAQPACLRAIGYDGPPYGSA